LLVAFKLFGAFAKLRKVIISFVMLSVLLSTWNNSAPTGPFSRNLTNVYFSKNCRENSNLIKIGHE